MANPTIDSITFDKSVYAPGDTVTATVLYSNSNTHSTDPATTSYSVTFTVTDETTGESSSSVASFDVSSPVSVASATVNNLSDVTVTGDQTWTLVSDDHASKAIFTCKAPGSTPPPPGNLQTTSTNSNLGPFNYPGISESPVFSGGNTWVRQNEFDTSHYQATLNAYDPGNWWVVAKCNSQGGAVLAGPDVQQVYYDGNESIQAISAFTKLSSDWDITPPTNQSGFGYEYNFDLWVGDSAVSGQDIWNATEIMVWVNTFNQTPWQELGNPGTGHVTIAGVDYMFSYHKETMSNGLPRGPFNFVQANATSGTTDLLAICNWLMEKGYLGGTAGGGTKTYSPGLVDVEFGIEICSTNGTDQTFKVNKFTIDSDPLYGP